MLEPDLIATPMLSSSKKAIGQYEKPLIDSLTRHLSRHGYNGFPHVRLNVAWSPIVSDIDLLAVRQREITIIEVKSSHDKFARASSQLRRVSDFTDFAYIATDRVPATRHSDPQIGLLLVKGDQVETLVEARVFEGRPQQDSLFKLQKKCLRRLAMARDDQMSKFEMSKTVHASWNGESLRECVKRIVICDRNCERSCPIRSFTEVT